MPIVTPGKRPGARLMKSKVFGKKGGFSKKKGGYANLNLTPMVDMFTIIVIYLLQNFSTDGDILFMSKDIQLPSITSKLALERAPVVSVSADSISVDGARVVDVIDLTRDDTWNVPALEESMREKRRNIEQSAQMFNGKPFTGVVNMQADKGVEFKILKKVMFACNQAGFFNINFAGMTVTAPSAAPATAANH
jgi:biopolymer transport protein ExbD